MGKFNINISERSRDLMAAIAFYAMAVYVYGKYDVYVAAFSGILAAGYWINCVGFKLELKGLYLPFSVVLLPFCLISVSRGETEAARGMIMLLLIGCGIEITAKAGRMFARSFRAWVGGLPAIGTAKRRPGGDVPPSMPDECAKLQTALDGLHVNATVREYVDGAMSGKYYVMLERGQSIRLVNSRLGDIALQLGVRGLKMDTDGSYVTLEFNKPETERQAVLFSDIIKNPEFMEGKRAIPLGVETGGTDFWIGHRQLPHLLVAGKSGSGKTSFLRSIIMSLALKNTPGEMGMVLCDGKGTEFHEFENLPHLLYGIASAQEDIEQNIQEAADEMRERQGGGDASKLIVIFIDEADAVLAHGGKEFKQNVIDISRLGRTLGFFLVLASQRPDKNTITGAIQANFSRVGLLVADKAESIRAIGIPGAEKLPGDGAMYFVRNDTPYRLQGYYLPEEEARRMSDGLSKKYPAFGSANEPDGEPGYEPSNIVKFSGPASGSRYEPDRKPLVSAVFERPRIPLGSREPMNQADVLTVGSPEKCREPDDGGPYEPAGQDEPTDENIVRLYQSGYTERDIADMLDTNKSKVHRVLKKFSL
jgi:hypothetical protein